MQHKNVPGILAALPRIAPALLATCLACLCISCSGYAGAENGTKAAKDAAPKPSRQEEARQALAKAAASEAPASEEITGMFIPFGPGADAMTAKAFALAKGREHTRIIILAGTDDPAASLAVFPEAAPEKTADGASGPGGQSELKDINRPAVTIDHAGIAALQKALPAPRPAKPQKGQKAEDIPLVVPLAGPSANVLELPAMRSVLPFAAEAFPECPILPLALNRSTTPKQWEALAKALKPLAQPGKKQKTLVIYVGNASSGLDMDAAREHDQQTMRVLAAGTPKLVEKMSEPGHVDSLACLYVLISLQRDPLKSVATVLDNVSVYGKQIESLPPPVKREKKADVPTPAAETAPLAKDAKAPQSAEAPRISQATRPLPGEDAPAAPKLTPPLTPAAEKNAASAAPRNASSPPNPNPEGAASPVLDADGSAAANTPATVETNQILAVYAKGHLPVTAGAARYFAGGDFLAGRNMKTLFANPTRRELMISRILERTGGHPLIVNFEGVLMDPDESDPLSRSKAKLPEGGMRLWMPKEDTLEIMAELNIIAVSIANNHTYDFGAKAYARNQEELEEAGFPAAGQGEFRELPHFILAAATDCDNSKSPYAPILTKEDLAPLTEASPKFKKPVFATVHCGNEYKYKPNDRVREVAKMMEEAGAEVFIGHHPHMTGPYEATLSAFQFWSLGNFVFDQLRSETDGALLEIVFFDPGTYWIMQHPAENMFRNFHKK